MYKPTPEELQTLLTAARRVFDSDGSDQSLFKALREAAARLAPPPLIIVYNSADIDSSINVPTLWGPPSLKGSPYVTLDKGEEGGGRGETQPAEIKLLEGGCHPSYPNYVEL
jgi:hypothetical protein